MVERYHRTRGRHLGGAKRKQSEETKDDGQPGKTGENGRRLPDSEIKSKRIKSESQKPFKELFTVSF